MNHNYFRIKWSTILRRNSLIKVLPAINYLRPRPLNSRIEISRSHRFVFYRIPKSANSTILRTIVSYDPGLDPKYVYNNSEKLKNKTYFTPEEFGLRLSKKALKDFFIFAFVRNPFDRVLSAYLDKIDNPSKSDIGKPQKVCKCLGKSIDNKISFEEFIIYLKNGGLYENVHWIPQVDLLPYYSSLSFLGKVENLETDLQELIKQLFPKSNWHGMSENRPHYTGAQNKIELYYTDRLKQLVKELYWRDFEHFGYF